MDIPTACLNVTVTIAMTPDGAPLNTPWLRVDLAIELGQRKSVKKQHENSA